MANLVLVAPMQGWSASLDEVPDAVFADRLLGDGLAIDPTVASLYAPCDGEVITVPPQRHAVTLRATNGAEILLHVGIDTVALNGEGFDLKVHAGSRVKAGDLLLTFDMDLLAGRAKSLITPIVITDAVPISIVRRASGLAVNVGDFLMELAVAGSAQGAGTSEGRMPEEVTARVVVSLEHGIHARPAAMLASRVKNFAATVSVSLGGRTANARSAIGLMSLGVRKGDEIRVGGVGPDAVAAVGAFEAALRAMDEVGIKSPQSPGGSGQIRRESQQETRKEIRQEIRQEIHQETDGILRGVVASTGIAVGVAFHLVRSEINVVEAGAGIGVETARLGQALQAVRQTLQTLAAAERGPRREIITAHLEFLDDPELTAAANNHVQQGKSAGFAWRKAVRSNVDVLRSLPDARMAERADDLLDLESQVLAALEGNSSSNRHSLPPNAIVLANELLPSQLVALDPTNLVGICTSGGGPTSHVAILAAAMNVPMLVAAGPRLDSIPNDSQLVLDADHGTLKIAPGAPDLAAAKENVARRRARSAAERAAAQNECRTADGTRIEVFANVGSVAEAQTAVTQGAEGCGLLRTEFLFLERELAPDEAAQTDAYQRIVDAFAGRPVVIRTLDVGGDKPLTYMPLPREDNPALGVRGVRVSLLYPEMLAVQLRAILRVQPQGRCRILIPMISDAEEMRSVREMLDAARRAVGHEAPVLLGAMIETPASAMLADQISQAADFLSIGTNDLTQYSLAIDRGNPALASRLDALHPAVLRLIGAAARAARVNERDVTVCGGLASDPAAAAILIGLGVNELSAVPSSVPRIKALIRSLTIARCREVAARATDARNAAEVRDLIAQWAM